jgi:L-lysine exporter family protein LysE/ArgO
MLAFVNGMSLCMGLIVSIGPQNAELIRAGLLKERAYLLATVYIFCDLLLIAMGVLGVASLIALNTWIAFIFSWVAVVILLYLARNAFMRMKRLSAFDGFGENSPEILISRRETIKKGVVLSIFNPLVILETVIIIGSTASQYPAAEKWYFALGAMLTSIGWFYAVSFGAQRFSHLLSQPKHRRILEGTIGVILCLVAAWLACKNLPI